MNPKYERNPGCGGQACTMQLLALLFTLAGMIATMRAMPAWWDNLFSGRPDPDAESLPDGSLGLDDAYSKSPGRDRGDVSLFFADDEYNADPYALGGDGFNLPNMENFVCGVCKCYPCRCEG